LSVTEAQPDHFLPFVGIAISTMLMKEVGAINTRKRLKDNHDIKDISLVTFEEMENKVLTNNLTKSLEVNSAEKLVELNCRIGLVMKRTPITVSQILFARDLCQCGAAGLDGAGINDSDAASDYTDHATGFISEFKFSLSGIE
jgi:hypothetical protein